MGFRHPHRVLAPAAQLAGRDGAGAAAAAGNSGGPHDGQRAIHPRRPLPRCLWHPQRCAMQPAPCFQSPCSRQLDSTCRLQWAAKFCNSPSQAHFRCWWQPSTSRMCQLGSLTTSPTSLGLVVQMVGQSDWQPGVPSSDDSSIRGWRRRSCTHVYFSTGALRVATVTRSAWRSQVTCAFGPQGGEWPTAPCCTAAPAT